MSNERVHSERLHIGDAFGEALLACQAGGGVSGVAFELIERSDGYLGVTDAAKYFTGPDQWSRPTELAYRHATGRVLDIGAGAGRISLALQDGEQDVVALDVSPGASAVSRGRGVREVYIGSVFDLAASRPEPFDAFAMFGNNLALVGGRELAPPFLDALVSMARPGARIVGETLDPYQNTDPEHLAYHEENRRLGRMAGQLRLRARHQRLVTPWWEYLFCTPEELEEVVARTRWRLATAFTAGSPGAGGVSWSGGQWGAVLELAG